MVLQIRFAIWLTLQIEAEALHICKTFHHSAFTISAFHVGLCPPPHPARFLYARPPSLPRAPALQLPRVPAGPPYRSARPPSSFLAKYPSAAKVSRTSSSKVPPWYLHRQGVARLLQHWHTRRMSKWREGKKTRRRDRWKKKFRGGVYTLGLPSLNAKSLEVGLFLDFANEFGTLQRTSNTKFICKVPWRCSKTRK